LSGPGYWWFGNERRLMASVARRTVVMGWRAVFPGRRRVTRLRARPVSTVAGIIERALEAAGKHENAEALLVGLGATALCVLLGYAIIVLSKFQVGLFAIMLG
jgi:hypothetical protein